MWRKQSDSPLPPLPEAPLLRPAPPAGPPISLPGRTPEDAAGSQIAAGLSIRGGISGDAPLHFEGTLDGPIHLHNADLKIGVHGTVRGAIEAREVHIQGSVEGEVAAAVRISLRAGCNVTGQLTSPRIAIEEGACFSGRVEMSRPGDARQHNASSSLHAPAATEALPLFAGQPSSPSSLSSQEQSEVVSENSSVRREP